MSAILPTMLFDGECGFCRRRIEKWKQIAGHFVRFAPFQTALPEFPQVSEMSAQRAVQLVLPDRRVFSGAHAVFKAFDIAGKRRWCLWLYDHAPFAALMSEWIYDFVSRHRCMMSKIA